MRKNKINWRREIKHTMQDAWFFNWINPIFWIFIVVVLVVFWTFVSPSKWIRKQVKNIKDHLWIKKNGDAEWCRGCYKNITRRGSHASRKTFKKRHRKMMELLLKRRWILINKTVKESCNVEFKL